MNEQGAERVELELVGLNDKTNYNSVLQELFGSISSSSTDL